MLSNNICRLNNGGLQHVRKKEEATVETVLQIPNIVYTFPPSPKFLFILINLSQSHQIFVTHRLIFEPFNHLYHMELFQELVFTISFSLIVSLLIAKLFAVASSSDYGNSTVSIRVEEKIETDWVFCGSEKDEKVVCCCGLLGEDCVKSVEVWDESSVRVGGECYVFDEMPERSEAGDAGVGLVESDEGNAVESSGLLIQKDCVKFDGVEHGSSVSVSGDSYVFDEMPERTEDKDASVDLMESDEDNGSLVQEVFVKSVEVKVDEVFDDDWQGIETTELEKTFGAAVAFMDSKSSADRVNLMDNEVKVELYGLHKVAIEGSCFEPQPMALKVSARANWNSWKRLENLGREDAMEQYITLLSQHVPDWIGRHASDKQ
ncbi:putative acyl-CoA-binding protein, ACBP [Helianthus annuus]|nr:putative acyl-CoA-binding protein, ACBP [Helianthus annuus]KAJ0506106.1 putative acyl-CoA-binding protein, ACBP [Helianthus annuus]KAJ0675778.1 putative acyl-CoA-binding protein, ACBP [Helianthus annuus]